MTMHIAVSDFKVRTFDAGLCVDVERPIYELTEPYSQYLSVHIDDTGTARVEGLHKTPTKHQYNKLKFYCAFFGARRITYRYNGIEHNIDLTKLKPPIYLCKL